MCRGSGPHKTYAKLSIFKPSFVCGDVLMLPSLLPLYRPNKVVRNDLQEVIVKGTEQPMLQFGFIHFVATVFYCVQLLQNLLCI